MLGSPLWRIKFLYYSSFWGFHIKYKYNKVLSKLRMFVNYYVFFHI